jgi:multicomponent Na+:H+ antiporter subunit G
VSGRELIVVLLAGAAVLAQVLCALGVLTMRSPYERLHFASASTTVAPLLLAAAILVDESISSNAITALLVAGFLAVFGPVITHGTARAALVWEEGQEALEEGER